MKYLILLLIFVSPMTTLYDFKMNSLDGDLIDFSVYKGKTLLIVNVASKCGFTPQYADLQQMQDQYGSKVVILGFPANNFGGQEPGTKLEFLQIPGKTRRHHKILSFKSKTTRQRNFG